jgi:hypothetical protein
MLPLQMEARKTEVKQKFWNSTIQPFYVLQVVVFWVMTPRSQNPEDHDLKLRSRENLKPRIISAFSLFVQIEKDRLHMLKRS